ncbi:unnamed protein product [Didymodactylos carnosus]|uniref:CDP-diacylglycerol--inositol 3-phosphatidyltransferase n=1 Tax=Didymodactylos carnosus TaxID=1234261 RepID=A0A813QAJ4_9BILA|nr:unnamed protein product [Didymodactylos carnosus]CAF3545946.1 unnamed protein product [Didymodactylos carnosus]
MSVIHISKESDVIILDQFKFLSNIYENTIDTHQKKNIRKSLNWSKDLFNVEKPFRTTIENKNKKRKLDEFLADDNLSIAKLNHAVVECKNVLSSEPSFSESQSEHSFDTIPFAMIATQQKKCLNPINRITLNDYFLNASKLGLKPNILYSHEYLHPCQINTIFGDIVLPAQCRFLWSDFENINILLDGMRTDIYNWSDLEQIKALPIELLTNNNDSSSSLICCWSTNCSRIEDYIKNDLFPKWKCLYLSTWHWLKVTRSGDPVLDFTSKHKKSYETLIIGFTGVDDERFSSLKNSHKIICSIPALVHSCKPPLYGYVRVFLSIVSFYFMPTHPKITLICYLTSQFLDALDGHAARALGQSTKFGAMFDMLTDRCSTMCLCFVLTMFYPKWALFFQLWAAIDVASHWLHLHVATMKGSESHKKIDLSGNPILRLYYTSRKVLFVMCAGNELWFSMLYMLHFTEGPALIRVGLYTVGLFRSILYLTTPIMISKQIISLIHLYTASLDMATIDEDERAKAKMR